MVLLGSATSVDRGRFHVGKPCGEGECLVLGRAGVRNDNRSQKEVGSSKKEKEKWFKVMRNRGETTEDGDGCW